MKSKFTYLLLLFFSLTVWAQNDCPEAITVCGGMDYFGLEADGIGDIQELTTNACSLPNLGDSEDNTIWLRIVIKDGGTLGFVLTPESNNLYVDFDFWLFGPNVECGALGVAERCSTTNPINAGLSYNTTGMNDISEDFSEGPAADGDAFVEWVTVEDDDIYYLLINRPHGFSNFSIEWTGTANFHEVPVFLNPDNIPLDMSLCDDSDGEFDQAATFDLTVYEAMFTGSQTDVEITYHNSLNDVTTGEDPIPVPGTFVSTVSLQTIYLRMTNPITGCFAIESFNVEIPVLASQPLDLELCDINYTGVREFDLSENEFHISGNVPGSIVTYHTTENDAINEVNPIGPLYENQVPYESDVIWARLERQGETCIDVISFTITVNPMPVFNNPDNISLDIEKCDDDGVFDQMVTFDLTIHEDMFTGTQENILITYHHTEDDAISGNNSIDNPTVFVSSESSTTIYVRMTNTQTGCHVFEEFDIIIPVLAADAQDIMLCDTNNNGIQQFDLSQNDDLVIGTYPNATVTYYTSQENAEDEISPIGPLYENEVPYAIQTIWARLDVTGETCFDLIPFIIGIFSFDEYPDVIQCDNDSVNGITVFDLTINENLISGGDTNVSFTYFANSADLANNNPITTPDSYTNTTNPQTIYIAITNPVTGCNETQEFEILNTVLTAGVPENLFLCDTNLNGLQEFDLALNTNLINNGNTTGTVVTFYLTLQDAQNDTNAISPMHGNTTAYTAETIWARVERVSNPDCFDVTSFTININELPIINNPQNIVLDLNQCDDDGVDDASNEFDLTVHEAMFTGNQTDIVFTYYASLQDLMDNNPIAVPQAYTNVINPQTVYVQTQNTLTGCLSLPESFTIEITNPVIAGEPQDLWQCDLDLNGQQMFILSLNDDYIKNGLQGIVTYYASQEDALNEANPLNDVHINSTPYTGQTIWARLESTTGCLGFDITSFTISVTQLPEMDYTVSAKDFSEFDNSIVITLDNWEDFEYSLDDENYIDVPYFDNLVPGLYTVYIRSKDGCRTAEEEVIILNYPKFFTPNGDGINETWQVFYIYFLPKSKISIFDRYGKLVSSFWGDHIGWDGNYNGEALPSTDYWFLIELEDGRSVKGHFAMVR